MALVDSGLDRETVPHGDATSSVQPSAAFRHFLGDASSVSKNAHSFVAQPTSCR